MPEQLTYTSPYPVYGMSWSPTPLPTTTTNNKGNAWTLCQTSFMEEYAKNTVDIIGYDSSDGRVRKQGSAGLAYPATKCSFGPSSILSLLNCSNTAADGTTSNSGGCQMIACSGDYLRLFRVSLNNNYYTGSSSSSSGGDTSTSQGTSKGAGEYMYNLDQVSVLSTSHPTTSSSHSGNNGNSGGGGHPAPITSFDWSPVSPRTIATASLDTTISIWDISRPSPSTSSSSVPVTQLIAHDKPIYDVAFTQPLSSSDLFGSVSADGSLRMFDARSLEHSTILYETCSNNSSSSSSSHHSHHSNPSSLSGPLMRMSCNALDPNYIATFHLDSPSVLILDVRVPCIPVCELSGGHTAPVNAVQWAPHSSGHLISVGDDGGCLVWDVGGMKVRSSNAAGGGGGGGGGGEPVMSYSAAGEVSSLSWNAVETDWVSIGWGRTVEFLRL